MRFESQWPGDAVAAPLCGMYRFYLASVCTPTRTRARGKTKLPELEPAYDCQGAARNTLIHGHRRGLGEFRPIPFPEIRRRTETLQAFLQHVGIAEGFDQLGAPQGRRSAYAGVAPILPRVDREDLDLEHVAGLRAFPGDRPGENMRAEPLLEPAVDRQMVRKNIEIAALGQDIGPAGDAIHRYRVPDVTVSTGCSPASKNPQWQVSGPARNT